MGANAPNRGQVCFVEFHKPHPQDRREIARAGHEQQGRRPALVLSVDEINSGPLEMLVVVPMKTTLRKNPFHILVKPPEANLTEDTHILCEQVRSVSEDRIRDTIGQVSEETMSQVEQNIRLLLGLDT